jgi:hypothetical protein
MRDKHKLTEELVALLPEQDRVNLKFATSSWWYNLRRKGGMRLTTTGYRAMVDELELEHYSYSIDDPHTFDKQLILKLDRRMQMPYYIDSVKGIPKRIVFFGSQEAVMVNLYGNLSQFLDNYRT